MRWVLLWLVLLIGAGVFLTIIGRRLWRQTKMLKAEVSRASARMREVREVLERSETGADR